MGNFANNKRFNTTGNLMMKNPKSNLHLLILDDW